MAGNIATLTGWRRGDLWLLFANVVGSYCNSEKLAVTQLQQPRKFGGDLRSLWDISLNFWVFCIKEGSKTKVLESDHKPKHADILESFQILQNFPEQNLSGKVSSWSWAATSSLDLPSYPADVLLPFLSTSGSRGLDPIFFFSSLVWLPRVLRAGTRPLLLLYCPQHLNLNKG